MLRSAGGADACYRKRRAVRFWVFYGALSNVGFELTVTDRVTGERAVYANPSGTFASRGDTTAFPAD